MLSICLASIVVIVLILIRSLSSISSMRFSMVSTTLRRTVASLSFHMVSLSYIVLLDVLDLVPNSLLVEHLFFTEPC